MQEKIQMTREQLRQLQHELNESVRIQIVRLGEVEKMEAKLKNVQQELAAAKECLKNGVENTLFHIEKFKAPPDPDAEKHSFPSYYHWEREYIHDNSPYRLEQSGRVNKMSATVL